MSNVVASGCHRMLTKLVRNKFQLSHVLAKEIFRSVSQDVLSCARAVCRRNKTFNEHRGNARVFHHQNAGTRRELIDRGHCGDNEFASCAIA